MDNKLKICLKNKIAWIYYCGFYSINGGIWLTHWQDNLNKLQKLKSYGAFLKSGGAPAPPFPLTTISIAERGHIHKAYYVMQNVK